MVRTAPPCPDVAFGAASCMKSHIIAFRGRSAAQASVTCAATGPISVPDLARIRGSEGREVFSERKGLSLFKNKVLCQVTQGLHACLV